MQFIPDIGHILAKNISIIALLFYSPSNPVKWNRHLVLVKFGWEHLHVWMRLQLSLSHWTICIAGMAHTEYIILKILVEFGIDSSSDTTRHNHVLLPTPPCVLSLHRTRTHTHTYTPLYERLEHESLFREYPLRSCPGSDAAHYEAVTQ